MKKSFIFFSLLFSLPLAAQVLTLQESINKSLQNHPDIKSFQLKVEQNKANCKSVYADYLPQINLQANYNVLQTFALSTNGGFETVDDDGWSAGINIKQKIWDFDKTSSKIDASKIDKKISELSLADLKALLVYKVKSLYLMMVLQKEAIKVKQNDLKSKQAYYRQALALVDNGLKTSADSSRFLSAVYMAQDNLEIAKASYEKAKESLSLYIGEKISDNITLQDDIIKQHLDKNEDFMKEVFKNNYQLKIFNDTIEKNRLLHKSVKASHYGTIDAVGSYTHIDNLNSYNSKLVGIVLNIPLYSGGRVSAEVQKAEISKQIATEQKVSKLLELKDELNSLLIDIKSYTITIKAKKEQLKSAMSTKKVLEARYEEGLTTYIEILDATSLVLNAKLGLLEAYYHRSIAIYKIEYLKGKI